MDGISERIADPALMRRLERLARGEPPRVLDMFSGAGGISLGFHKAGFRIDGALEIDELAARTHATNFHGSDPELLELHAATRDMTKVEPDQLCDELGLGSVDDCIDVLVGGPPCQAYARVGRAKLREIYEHPTAYKVDPRGNLFLRYLDYVKAIKPLAILMENVPDILHYGHHNVIEEIVEALDVLGYEAKYSLINSAFHGVPQMRDRVFLVAYRKELRVRPLFPRATHHLKLPPGYAVTRTVALRYVDLLGSTGYQQADLGDESLPFAVTAERSVPRRRGFLSLGPSNSGRKIQPTNWRPYAATSFGFAASSKPAAAGSRRARPSSNSRFQLGRTRTVVPSERTAGRSAKGGSHTGASTGPVSRNSSGSLATSASRAPSPRNASTSLAKSELTHGRSAPRHATSPTSGPRTGIGCPTA
jgi:DNA-cytosine methyltransferase